MKNKITLILIVTLFFNCIGHKNIVKKDRRLSDLLKVTKTVDSSKVVKKSLEIKDHMSFSLRTNDKLIDSIIRKRLKGFSTEKISGTNKFSAKFDYNKLALSVATIIGETNKIDVKTRSNTDKIKESKDKESNLLINKVMIVPWWVWLLIVFWILPQIISKLNFFLSPIKKALFFFKKTNQ